MGTLPEDRTFKLGFRVVLGEAPKARPLPVPPVPRHQQNVIDRPAEVVKKGPDPAKPYFRGPRRFVNIPREANGPVFAAHNHDPAIVACPNGDLLASWYTCVSESNRELAHAASRLRFGADDWEPASSFWNAPDRNDHAPAFGLIGGRIYNFSGHSHGSHYHSMALLLRTSDDSGRSWSRTRIVLPEYNHYHMPSEPVFRMKDGTIVMVSDWPSRGGFNWSGLWKSRDEGLTWHNPGGGIRGIHGAVAEIGDGGILGYGRSEGGQMPKSVSRDVLRRIGG